MKLNKVLGKFDIEVEKIEHERSGKTTEQASEALGEEKSRILKSLLLKSSSGKYVGAIVSGNKNVNMEEIENYFEKQGKEGYKNFRLANPKEVKEKLGYKVGGVPPFAFHGECPTFYDRKLLDKGYVVGAGGDRHTGLKFNPRALKKLDFIGLDLGK